MQVLSISTIHGPWQGTNSLFEDDILLNSPCLLAYHTRVLFTRLTPPPPTLDSYIRTVYAVFSPEVLANLSLFPGTY